jgi:drug/metabolite transporter (DMT)-like permease
MLAGSMAAVLALLSAVTYGAGDPLGGLAARRLPPAAVALRSNVIGLVGLVAVAPLFDAPEVVARDIAYGMGGGVVGGVGLLLLYRGLAAGTMSVVAPITAVLAAIVPVVFGLVDGERPSGIALSGIPVALVAIALLSRDGSDHESERRTTPAVVMTALGAGLGFGLFFVSLDKTGDDAGLWPLVAGRTASVAMFAIVALLVVSARVGSDAARRGTTPRLLLVCGLCDSGANALFLLATHEGLLSLVAVLGSLYPASTVALATTFTHERLTRTQIAGVVLAFAAVVAITAG